MTTLLAKYISKKVLGETIANNFGKEDPYFESVPATRLDGKPTNKMKKRRKALPQGISEHDAKVLTKVKRRAYRLDMCLFSCCGIRFGWSSVIGMIPVIGDVVDAFMAMMVLRTCTQIEGGLPNDVKAKMMFNIIVDFGIGLIVFVGDIFDAVFRANTKNAILLEKHLREKGLKALKASGQSTPPIDPTDPNVFDEQLREELGPPPQYTSGAPGRQGISNDHGNGRSARTQEPIVELRGGGGGWFSGRTKQPDLEHGHEPRREQARMPASNPQYNEPRRPAGTLQKNRY